MIKTGKKVKSIENGKEYTIVDYVEVNGTFVYNVGNDIWFGEDMLKEIPDWKLSIGYDFINDDVYSTKQVEEKESAEIAKEMNDNNFFERWLNSYLENHSYSYREVLYDNDINGIVKKAFSEYCQSNAGDKVWNDIYYIEIPMDLPVIKKGDEVLSLKDVLSFWDEHHKD